MGLDQILIQLKDIESDWRSLGVAVGAERLDEIAEFVRYIIVYMHSVS